MTEDEQLDELTQLIQAEVERLECLRFEVDLVDSFDGDWWRVRVYVTEVQHLLLGRGGDKLESMSYALGRLKARRTARPIEHPFIQ